MGLTILVAAGWVLMRVVQPRVQHLFLAPSALAIWGGAAWATTEAMMSAQRSWTGEAFPGLNALGWIEYIDDYNRLWRIAEAIDTVAMPMLVIGGVWLLAAGILIGARRIGVQAPAALSLKQE